jgi:hypothetical protein
MNAVSGAAATLSGEGVQSGVSSVISYCLAPDFLAHARAAPQGIAARGAFGPTQGLEMAHMSGKPNSSEGGNGCEQAP